MLVATSTPRFVGLANAGLLICFGLRWLPLIALRTQSKPNKNKWLPLIALRTQSKGLPKYSTFVDLLLGRKCFGGLAGPGVKNWLGSQGIPNGGFHCTFPQLFSDPGKKREPFFGAWTILVGPPKNKGKRDSGPLSNRGFPSNRAKKISCPLLIRGWVFQNL